MRDRSKRQVEAELAMVTVSVERGCLINSGALTHPAILKNPYL